MKIKKWCVLSLSAALLAFSGAAFASDEGPSEFLGDWVPESMTCQSQLRFRIEAKRVVLINATQSKSFGNLDFCRSCAGGARYEGNIIFLIPEFGGKGASPFFAYLNADEKMGVVKLDIQNAQLKRQFPLDNVALKKCAPKKPSHAIGLGQDVK